MPKSGRGEFTWQICLALQMWDALPSQRHAFSFFTSICHLFKNKCTSLPLHLPPPTVEEARGSTCSLHFRKRVCWERLAAAHTIWLPLAGSFREKGSLGGVLLRAERSSPALQRKWLSDAYCHGSRWAQQLQGTQTWPIVVDSGRKGRMSKRDRLI